MRYSKAVEKSLRLKRMGDIGFANMLERIEQLENLVADMAITVSRDKKLTARLREFLQGRHDEAVNDVLEAAGFKESGRG